MSEHKLISVDLAKDDFQLCAMTNRMNVVFNRHFKRKDVARFMGTQKPVEVVIEACYRNRSRISQETDIGWLYCPVMVADPIMIKAVDPT
jgi:hypothetical protein